MIINELAYKVTIKADEFLNGKRKVKAEAQDLKNEIEKSSAAIEKSTTASMSKTTKETDKAAAAMKGLTSAFNGFLGLSTRFMVVGGVLTAVAIGIHRAFESTAESIVRASNMGRMLGTNASNVLGTQYGFSRIGQNGGAFLGAQMSAKMALANIEDPTIFGGLTPEAQNLLTTGARTGIDIHKLGGRSEDALAEFQKYGKGHNEKQLMQVLAAFGYDPNLAGDIKNGKAVKMVSEEEKRWKMTKDQEEAQRNILATTKALDSQFEKVKQDLMATFGPEVLKAEQEFLEWLKNNKGDIIGFFKGAGDVVKKLTDNIGTVNTLLLLLAAGLRANPLVMGAVAAAAASNKIDQIRNDASAQNKTVGQYLYDRGHEEKTPFLTWDSIKEFFSSQDPAQHAQSARRAGDMYSGSMDDLLHGVMMTESSGNPLAYNAKSGAAGAYQFKPGTARDVGLRVDSQVDERLDPEKARAAAAIYMRQLLKRYDGNVDNALRAYNWGMGNVDKWIANGSDESQLPKETRDYTGKVYGNMGNARNYYATQGRMADRSPYQLSSSGGNPQITNSTHINTVNVNSNPQSVDALTKSVEKQAQRSTTNAAFSSAVRG